MAFAMTISELIASDTTGLLNKHSSWERICLSDVAEILNGAPFDSALFSTTEGVPLIRIRDIATGVTSTFYTGPYEDIFQVNHGDLLIGMDGDFNSGFWGAKLGLLNQRVCKISPTERFYSKKLLGYVLPAYLVAINANTSSVTVKHLSSKTIGEIELPLPPLSEQHRIVAKLEELLTDLDSGVAELETARKKLKQYRQSLLKAAVDGTLTADWRSRNPVEETGAQLLTRILFERHAQWEKKQLKKFKDQDNGQPKGWQGKYLEPVLPNTSDLPELPHGWVFVKIALAGEVQLGRQRAPQYHTGTNMVPYLRVANVFEERIDVSDVKEMHFSPEDEDIYHLNYNDILLNEGQSLELIGRPAIFRNELPRACFTNTLVRFKPISSLMPEFALLVFLNYMHSGKFRKIASITTNIAHLGAGRFANLEFPFPPFIEQREIISQYQQLESALREQQTAVEHALKQAAAQRKNILKAAFSGQLVPQDPTDEPASVLLARIRDERAAREKVKKPRGSKA